MAIKFEYTIKEEMGLHARPAGLLAKYAKNLPCLVFISCKDNSCDARKLIQLMSLEAQQGDTIEVTVEGEQELSASEELKEFLKEVL